MERIWLVVDARSTPPENRELPPQLASLDPSSYWLESTAGKSGVRQNLLEREADVLIVSEGSPVLRKFEHQPAWIESPGEGENSGPTFTAHQFDGTLDSLTDERFEELNDLLGNPELSFEATNAPSRKVAERGKKFYEYLEESVLILSVIPIFIVAFAALIQKDEVSTTTIIEQASILLSFGLALFLAFQKAKDRWTRARAFREIRRSLMASLAWVDPIYPIQARYFPDERGIIRSLIFAERISKPDFPAPDQENYLGQRLDDPKYGQIAFFSRSQVKAAKFDRIMKRVFIAATTISAIGAVITLGVHAGLIPDNTGWLTRVFYSFTGLFFPSIVVIAMGLIGLKGISRQSGFYRVMAERLRQIRREFDVCEDEECFQELVVETECVLLEENADWVRRNEF